MELTYRPSVSTVTPDPEWDSFLASIPGGHHAQSSLWGLVHACLGWQTVRIVIRDPSRMLAGAQILYRPLSTTGFVGYIPNGPVFATDDSGLRAFIFAELAGLARDRRILLLAAQPPADASPWLHEMSAYGFQKSKAKIGPEATVRLDLDQDAQALLSDMKARTRYNIRLSERRGIRVREGSAQDLDVYYDMLLATAERNHFVPPPSKLFREMWAILAPLKHVALFLAEREGRPVSAQLAVTFRDTVVNQLSVWSGADSDCKPNEALHWAAILWAKAHGYRRYDLEGVGVEAAQSVLEGRSLPDAPPGSYSHFKLGFGGRPILLPGVYDYIYDPAMRAVYKTVLTALPQAIGDWCAAEISPALEN